MWEIEFCGGDGIVDSVSVVDVVDVVCLVGVCFWSGVINILWNYGLLGVLYDYMVVYGVLDMNGMRGLYF